MIKTTTIGSITKLYQGVAINSKTKHILRSEGLPLLRIKDLKENKVEQFVDGDKVPKQCICYDGDIIFTRTGQVGLVFNNRNGVIHNNCFKVVPDEKIITKDYLYWFLSQKKIKNYLKSIASGSVQKDLNHSSFNSVSIVVPDLEYQIKATKILNFLIKK